MNELERLLARLGIHEASGRQTLNRLRPFFTPRCVWRSLLFDGSSLTLAEVIAILDALGDPKAQESRWAMHLESDEVKRRRDALSIIGDAVEQGEEFSTYLLQALQSRLRGRFAHEPIDESRPGAVHEFFLAWEQRPQSEFPKLRPFEDAAWILREMARRRPLGEANDAVGRLAASFVLSRVGLPPLLFGPEKREAYIEALRSNLEALARFLMEETSEGLTELLAAEKSAVPLHAVRLGSQLVERQQVLQQRLAELPAEDPIFIEARAIEVDTLASWVDYVMGRVEAASRGPLYNLHRSQVRNDWASRLMGSLYQPLYLGRATAVALRISPHREGLHERPLRFPATEASLTFFVVSTRSQLVVMTASPQATAIRSARKRSGVPTSKPSGIPPIPSPSAKDLAEAKIDLEGPALAADWSQAETEAWLLSWVERLALSYEEELMRLNGLE
jgi:plasmid stabilization system protein ParE